MAQLYEFRPMTDADLPLVRRWLQAPHVTQWWGDPERELALIAADVCDPRMALFIVHLEQRRIGYIQSYDPNEWIDDHPFGRQPPGTRGIDQFIGEPDFIGLGHGTAFIAAFAARLCAAGAPRVITDPDPRNARAVRAYRKAGFAPIGTFATTSGAALLMSRDGGTAQP